MGTSTWVALLQLLRVLDILLEWDNTEYRAWWFARLPRFNRWQKGKEARRLGAMNRGARVVPCIQDINC